MTMTRIHSDIEKKQRRADAVLAAAYARSGEVEPRMNGRSFMQFTAHVEEAEPGEDDEELALRLKHWRMFLDFIFAYGPAPDRATKRLYAMAWATRRALLLGMNQREVADVLGETRAATSNRVNTDFSDYLAAWGCAGTRVNGQKKESSRATYREAARGNTARKCGRKKGEG